jgi:hypothetical protein
MKLRLFKAAGKGVRSVLTVYRESRRAKDHKTGWSAWAVASAAGGGRRRGRRYIVPDIEKNALISEKTRHRYIVILHTHRRRRDDIVLFLSQSLYIVILFAISGPYLA